MDGSLAGVFIADKPLVKPLVLDLATNRSLRQDVPLGPLKERVFYILLEYSG